VIFLSRTKYSIGNLYIVATPIGNPLDITLRALEVLRSVDAVICEDRREGSKLAKNIGVDIKEWIEINEHNEADSGNYIQDLLIHGTNLALISDCGTPVFSDPGAKIIERALGLGANIIPIPGASSLMTALSIMDIPLPTFHFAGFLPRQPVKRQKTMDQLRKLNIPIIIMDTPYRLNAVIKDAIRSFGSIKNSVLACDLTMPNEKIYRGTLGEIGKMVNGKKVEFILIIY